MTSTDTALRWADSDLVANTDQQKFTVSAKNKGATTLYAVDPTNNVKASLKVIVGNFEKHPEMRFAPC